MSTKKVPDDDDPRPIPIAEHLKALGAAIPKWAEEQSLDLGNDKVNEIFAMLNAIMLETGQQFDASATVIIELTRTLEVVDQFIQHGIETGAISLPDDRADAAHGMPAMVKNALKLATQEVK